MNFDQARRGVDAYFANHLGYAPNELDFLLVGDADYQAEIATYLAIAGRREREEYSAETDAVYAQYQARLRYAIRQYLADVPSHRLIKVNAAAVDIQDRIRSALNADLELGLEDLGGGVKLLVGLGGLSESGKSGTAEYLHLQHGFSRLKLKYFVGLGERLNPAASLEAAIFEALEFMAAHRNIGRFTIESLHGPLPPALFKLMLGQRFQNVFLDVELNERIRRRQLQTGESPEFVSREVARKDAVKLGRGAETVRAIADVVWNNSGSMTASRSELAEWLLG